MLWVQYGRRVFTILKLAVWLRNGCLRNKIVYCAGSRLIIKSAKIRKPYNSVINTIQVSTNLAEPVP